MYSDQRMDMKKHEVGTSKKTLQLLTSFSLLWAASQASAQSVIVADPSSLLGPVAAGRGSSGVASSLRHDSLFINPAVAAAESAYTVNAVYGGVGDLMAASVVDTKSGPVGGGAYYLRRTFDSNVASGFLGDYARTEEQAGISLMGNVSDGISFGITGRYIRNRYSEFTLSQKNEWEGDMGIRWVAATGVTIGGTVRSLLADKSGLYPTQSSLGIDWVTAARIQLSGSVSRTSIRKSGVELDVGVPNSGEKYSYAAGVEWRATSNLSLRAGYSMLRPWNQNLGSVGIGYWNKSFSMDYAFIASVRGAKYQQHTVGASIQL
jgi:hypothetical protein